jgi:hypothetical protein
MCEYRFLAKDFREINTDDESISGEEESADQNGSAAPMKERVRTETDSIDPYPESGAREQSKPVLQKVKKAKVQVLANLKLICCTYANFMNEKVT